jgi:hypothetical protein
VPVAPLMEGKGLLSEAARPFGSLSEERKPSPPGPFTWLPALSREKSGGAQAGYQVEARRYIFLFAVLFHSPPGFVSGQAVGDWHS